MTHLEQHQVAEGILMHLQSTSDNPLDGVAILGLTLLMIFDQGTDRSFTIEKFAKEFGTSMIQSYKNRSLPGTETRQ